MFNGVPITTSDHQHHQFHNHHHHHHHQFIAAAAAANSSTSSSSVLPTIFTTIHGGYNDDLYNLPVNNVVPPSLPLPNINHQQIIQSKSSLMEEDLWSYDEILALLKVRSTIQNNWFPDLSNWEHVSRKLGELGFKRSPEQCKQKFEEQGPHESSLNYNNDKNYRNNIFTELDEFYPNQNKQEQQEEEEEKENKNLEERSPEPRSEEMNEELQVVKPNKKRKRMKDDKFETFKGFCETIVNKMMSQQEELHNKLIQYIVKKDAENIAREEAWKNQEMERIKIESEKRAQEQQSVEKRQAIIVEFLNKFTSEKDQQQNSNKNIVMMKETSTSSNNIDNIIIVNSTHKNQNTPKTPSPPRPNSSKESKYSQKGGGDMGMRWPRDQVFALINLRCKLSSSSSNNEESSSNKEGVKGPLWERISQGMLELGYKRSAKRCKEKWENINKYFRKTKDSNKKRSMDSRTCPYFHQLSCLYTEGTGTGIAEAPINSEMTGKEPHKD